MIKTIKKYFKFKQNLSKKDFIQLLVIITTSLFFSFVTSKINGVIFYELYFDIFNVIELKYWLIMMITGFFQIAIIRSVFFGLYIKQKFSKTYFKEMSFHILKYAFTSLPFIIPVIQVVTNQMVLDIVHEKNMHLITFGLFCTSIFMSIWLLFLGRTIREFLLIKYSKLKSIAINISTSLATSFVIGVIGLSYLNNIQQYKNSFIEEALSSLQIRGKISKEKVDFIKSNVK